MAIHKKPNKISATKEKRQINKDGNNNGKLSKIDLSKNKKDSSIIARNILLATIGIAVVAVLVFVLLAPNIYKTDFSYNGDSTVNHKAISKSNEELAIEDLLGVESNLNEVADLAMDKVSIEGVNESYCKGDVVEKSKKTFFDSKNNFNVVEHEVSLKAGVKDDDWKKYTIQSDGLLLKDSYDGKKKKSGKDVWDKLDTTSSHYSKYIKYGVLDVQCSVEFQQNYSSDEKGYIKEIDIEDDNILYTLFGTWTFRWGVYANGNLTTDSDTFILVIGKDSELNNDISMNALSESYDDENPYPNLAENISPISEIHIFNFDFSINEKTEEFVNKWSYTVSKNSKQ